MYADFRKKRCNFMSRGKLAEGKAEPCQRHRQQEHPVCFYGSLIIREQQTITPMVTTGYTQLLWGALQVLFWKDKRFSTCSPAKRVLTLCSPRSNPSLCCTQIAYLGRNQAQVIYLGIDIQTASGCS